MSILLGSVGLKCETVTEVYVYYAGLPVVKLFIAWFTGMFCAGSSPNRCETGSVQVDHQTSVTFVH